MEKKAAPRAKLYRKIGEACRILDIQPYVLRYWETEFAALAPSKSRSGQRVYTERELEIIRRIKQLLYEEGYTIAGAKKKLDSELESGGPLEAPVAAEESSDDGDSLDSSARERVERLRQGIRGALDEARAILSLLQ
jgi:DNA-binding transcriptional MerR regulator